MTQNIWRVIEENVRLKNNVIIFAMGTDIFVRQYTPSQQTLYMIRGLQKANIPHWAVRNGNVQDLDPEKTKNILSRKMRKPERNLPEKVLREPTPECDKMFNAGMYRPSRKRFTPKPSTDGANRIIG